MKFPNLALAAAVALLAAACGPQQDKSGGPGTAATPAGTADRDTDIVQDEGTFSINVPVTETDLDRGESDTLSFSIDRGDNFTQHVDLSFTGVPQGVTIAPATIAAGQDSVEVTITAAADAATGEATVTVNGKAAQGPPATNTFKIQVNE